MKKNFLFLSYTDEGGAGKANVNISKALLSEGHSVEFLVSKKTTNETFIKEINKNIEKKQVKKSIFERLINKIINKFKRKKTNPIFDTKYCYYNIDESYSNISLEDILKTVENKPDIIIGGWISHFINLENLGKTGEYFKAKVYVLMNDMAHLTGGCHYNWGCKGYENNCYPCPANSNISYLQSQKNLFFKKDSIERYNIEVIAGSKENIEEISNSFLFKIQNDIKLINGAIDFSLFNDKRRDIAKKAINISDTQKVILSGAFYIPDPRKGFKELQKTLALLNDILEEKSKKITFIVIGNNCIYNFKYKNIDFIHFEGIKHQTLYSLIHQAADVYVSPSLEDTGPAIVIEALACGTPVVGFEIGFVKNFIEDDYNGFKIHKDDFHTFAKKIYNILFDSDNESLRKNAIETVKQSFSSNYINKSFSS